MQPIRFFTLRLDLGPFFFLWRLVIHADHIVTHAWGGFPIKCLPPPTHPLCSRLTLRRFVRPLKLKISGCMRLASCITERYMHQRLFFCTLEPSLTSCDAHQIILQR